jgi:methyl-accepting chemotaxis protein
MQSRSPFSRLSVAAKLSLSATAVLLIVLFTAVGWVSLRIWNDAQAQTAKSLVDAAAAAAKLMDVYDDSARKAVLKDLGYLKGQLAGRFSLAGAGSAPGAGSLELLLDGKAVNGDVVRVDRFSESTGAVATLFMRQGEDLVRVSTSLKSAEGQRATGTKLDQKHPAYARLLMGQAYTGRAQLFGKTYATHYEPLRQGDQVIGAMFVGTDLTDLMAGLRQTLLTLRPHEQAVMLAVDVSSGATRGALFGLDGTRKIDGQDKAGAQWLSQLSKGQGTLSTDWSGALQAAAGEAMVVGYAYSQAWDSTLVCEAPKSTLMATAKANLVGLWLAMCVATVALLAMISALAKRLVGQPLGRLMQSLGHLAKGDLEAAVPVDRGDELGMLAKAMEEFRQTLQASLIAVRGNAEGVATASAQIASGNADLSQRTEEQASALQQTAASMEQLGSTVRQNADNAQQANQLAMGASTVAQRGGAMVSQVVETMKGINDSSKKIADIISVIDGIAFQTNILALNAAVEAARAGEQGRGFAVVASEVRNLAQRSAEAAKEIKSLITASVERVEQGTTLVDQTGATMQEIVTSIRRVTDIMGEINSASREQSTGVNQVGEAVGQMDQVTQQNAALVEESAAAAESLKQQAQQLVSAVAVFKLGSESMHHAPASSQSVHKPVAHRPLIATRPAAFRKAGSKPAAASAPAPADKPSSPAPKAAEPVTAGGSDDWEHF